MISTSSNFPGYLARFYSVVLLLASILCLAFKSTAFNSYMQQTDHGRTSTTVQEPSLGRDGFIDLYPLHLMPVGQGPVIAAASVSLVVSLAVVALSTWAFRSRRPLNLDRTQRLVVLAMLAANALLAMAVMIYELVQHGRSARFNPDHRLTGSSAWDEGPFTLEVWTCETPAYVSSFKDYDFGKQCLGERASRGLLVTMWLMSLAVLGCMAWDMKSAQAIIASKRRKAADWEDDGWD